MRRNIREYKEARELSRLLVVKANNPSLLWQNDEEFSDAGVMYDVIEKHREDGKTVIYCVPDARETELVNTYRHACTQQNGQQPLASLSLLKLITAGYVLPKGWQLDILEAFLSLDRFDISQVFSSQCLFVMVPPPWTSSTKGV